jgi:protoporphyrinogen oxidase
MLETAPIVIRHSDKAITSVITKKGATRKTIEPDEILSSIPVTELLALLEPSPPEIVLSAAAKLRFRAHTVLFITLNKPYVFKDQWIYFPEQEIPFGRIMEPRNFNPQMSPEARTSLLLEFFCWEGDEIWNMNARQLLDTSLPWLEKLEYAKKSDIINTYVHRERHAYPVYDLHYKKHLKVIKSYLRRFENLHLIGRSGLFRYNNMDHAIEMGLIAAKNIVRGTPYDLDAIGTEKEYFEKGYVK